MKRFFTSINCVVSPRHVRVILVVTAEGVVVIIQTFGASCESMLIPEAFLIYNEHLAEILAVFLAYNTVMHDSVFASG